MNSKIRTFLSILMGMAAVAVLSLTAIGNSEHDEHQHAVDPEYPAQGTHEQVANPLIEEMVALDAVFRDVVSGVAMGDGKRVHEALEKMHGTMEKTHEGVRHGTVTLKKNANRLKEFVEQDKEFHGKLEELAKAVHRNDGNAMLSLTKALLDGCVRCHRDFRNP
ncbi:MAG: hypothetical protein H6Q96_475 [Nitrospirae bacterium]|nr:hypothetical protein [Nitrospirota bacterium]